MAVFYNLISYRTRCLLFVLLVLEYNLCLNMYSCLWQRTHYWKKSLSSAKLLSTSTYPNNLAPTEGLKQHYENYKETGIKEPLLSGGERAVCCLEDFHVSSFFTMLCKSQEKSGKYLLLETSQNRKMFINLKSFIKYRV